MVGLTAVDRGFCSLGRAQQAVHADSGYTRGFHIYPGLSKARRFRRVIGSIDVCLSRWPVTSIPTGSLLHLGRRLARRRRLLKHATTGL
jgi:hypothetical protein